MSLPILFFFLLRWLWIFLIWAGFLFRVSRLDLELTPTHPDHVGGLGFLGWGLAGFAPVLMAISAVLSGSFAYEIVHRGSSLNVLKYHVIVFVVLAIGVLHAPLLVFTGRWRGAGSGAARFRGVDRGARPRLRREVGQGPGSEPGRAAGQPRRGLARGLAQVYEHVEEMQLVPFDKKALIVLVAAMLIPMIPLLGTVIGLTEILSMLGKFMV